MRTRAHRILGVWLVPCVPVPIGSRVIMRGGEGPAGQQVVDRTSTQRMRDPCKLLPDTALVTLMRFRQLQSNPLHINYGVLEHSHK